MHSTVLPRVCKAAAEALTREGSTSMNEPAVIFDCIEWLFKANGFNDHELHCVLSFGSGLDMDLLRRAVLASIEVHPILGSRWVSQNQPHWARMETADLSRAFVPVRSEAELYARFHSPEDETLGPQLRVYALPAASCTVAIKINHMVCDAADFKSYLYQLSALHSKLAQEPGFRPAVRAGDRSLRQMLSRFSLRTKLRSLLKQGRQNNHFLQTHVPMEDGGAKRPILLTHTLDREQTLAAKQRGRERGATLNDVLLAAMYRGLFRQLEMSAGEELQIPVMVDMRRYLGGAASSAALTNLSSMVSTQIAYRPEESFEETLDRVKAIMDARKEGNLGLNGFLKLMLTFRLLGTRSAIRALRTRLKNPYICMTNIGILDAARMAFGNEPPQAVLLFGAMKYRPYFQLAVSTYRGAMTLSVNLWGSDADESRLRKILDAIAGEMHQLGPRIE